MNKQEFNNVVNESFKEYGFMLVKNILLMDLDGFLIRIGKQKSNYSEGFYLNYFIIIKDLHTEEELKEPTKIFDFTIGQRIIFPAKFNKHYCEAEFFPADKTIKIKPFDFDCFMYKYYTKEELKVFLKETLSETFDGYKDIGLKNLESVVAHPSPKTYEYLKKNGIKV